MNTQTEKHEIAFRTLTAFLTYRYDMKMRLNIHITIKPLLMCKYNLLSVTGFIPMWSVDFYSTGKNNKKPVVPGP